VMSAHRWVYPKDTVFAKTYTLEMEQGNPATRRRIETQVLHFNGIQWAAYSYRWNEAQTDAELLGPRGAETDFAVKDAAAPGGVRREKWRFFTRTECLRCHNLWDNFAPGYSEWQLNRDQPGGPGKQLDLLTRLGLAPTERQNDVHLPDDAELHARSYLHATCSVCHRISGGGSVPSLMNIEIPLKEARLVSSKPVQGDLGLRDARVIAPGAPTSSVLLYRLTTGGRGHMPYLGGRLVDDHAVLVLRDWIASLPPEPGLSAAVTAERAAEKASLAALAAGDGAQIGKLLESRSGALGLALAVIDGSVKDALREQAITEGAAHPDPLRRDLFERMLPEERRRKTLGPEIKPETLLGLQGDAARGKVQFTAICAACHRAGELGVDFAPDLSHVATRLERAKIVERILQPSKNIEPQWELATLETATGETLTGFIESRNDHDFTLRQAGGGKKTVPAEKIVKVTTAKVGVMPEGILQGFTAEEAGDLLAFLWGLK
jgi:putative heme-binding domain-containing protein